MNGGLLAGGAAAWPVPRRDAASTSSRTFSQPMPGLVTIGSSRRLELTDGEQVLFVEFELERDARG